MKVNVVVGSIFGAALLIVVSFVSAVGYQSGQNQTGDSPLFAVRSQRAMQQPSSGGVAAYLGKGSRMNLFPLQASRQMELIQTALNIFRTHPALFAGLVKNLDKYPYIAEALRKQGITTADVTLYLQMLQDDPSFVADELRKVSLSASDTGPAPPLGLSTSSALGCFIVAMFALLPLTIVMTLLLLFFTLRILTCMNVNDCANALAQSIWSQIIQGLTPE